jgi:polyisoprenoid-binding protein YceI
MHSRLAACLALAAALAPAGLRAEEGKSTAVTFHFGTNESRTTVTFESETSLETIHGTCKVMSGTATFDFDKGEGSAELKVPVKELKTGLEKRDEHLRSDGWLDAEKFPEIVFKAKSLKRTKSDEATKKETWAYEGEFTLHGVTREWKGEATVQRVPEAGGRLLGPGQWVKVKAAFQVTLKDFGITVPETSAAKVSPTWDVKVDVFGTTAAPKKE